MEVEDDDDDDDVDEADDIDWSLIDLISLTDSGCFLYTLLSNWYLKSFCFKDDVSRLAADLLEYWSDFCCWYSTDLLFVDRLLLLQPLLYELLEEVVVVVEEAAAVAAAAAAADWRFWKL